MHPIMRLVLPTIGIFIAASFGSPANRAFELIVGAAVGFLIADLGILRTRLDDLFKELDRLKKDFRRRQDVQTASAPDPLPNVTEYPEIPRPHSAPRAQPDRPWREIEPRNTAPSPSVPDRPAVAAAPASAHEDKVVAAIRGFFTGGNTLVRVGVIVLFFGVAFLLRYMAEHSHISIEVRLTGVALASIALIILGWRLRKTRGGYALALQGGGVGILYLIVFAALRLYSILPATIAFPALVVIAILSAALAVLQNSMAFALLGLSGGFLAPVLASTGEGSHVVLFS